VLPGASASLRRHSDDDQSDWSAEFEIEAGNAAVSAARGTSVLLSLPHAVAVVRGAAAAEASAGFSRISVLEGSAAFLPKGPLLAALLDGRTANPVAGAVVRAALASAPLVRAGEALEAATPADACEAAYSALLVGAERAISNGFVLDAAADPRPFIAAAGSPAAEALEAALSAYRPRRLSPDERTALSALDACPSTERLAARPIPPASWAARSRRWHPRWPLPGNHRVDVRLVVHRNPDDRGPFGGEGRTESLQGVVGLSEVQRAEPEAFGDKGEVRPRREREATKFSR
jgi:hypothetical protein